jgi:uncharacterized protein with GYD domain
LCASTGGKLLGWYVTLGDHDWLTIIEAPSAKEATAAILAAVAGGATTDVETVQAFTGVEAKEAFALAAKAAGKYKPPS